MRTAFVLCGDFNYVDKMTTTIKSIVRHHNKPCFYIIHTDFPQEWFVQIRKRLSVFQAEIHDVRINVDSFNVKSYQTHGHINYGAYLRYFIPEVIDEERLLYLDSDLVVTANLQELFDLELDGHYVAAIADRLGPEPELAIKDYFNSGVMLINAPLWRQEKITQRLLELTDEQNGQMHNGDQTILNMAFENGWLELDEEYNFQVGSEFYIPNHLKEELIQPLTQLPKVIHYTTEKKPWAYDQFTRLREVWWQYYQLDWSEIAYQKQGEQVYRPKLLVMTYSANLEQIDYLLEQLPNYDIQIAAWTNFAPHVYSLLRYENCKLYPRLFWQFKNQLVAEADALLDINHGPEFDQIIEEITDQNKPIFAFENTVKNREKTNLICPESSPQQMIRAIQEYFREPVGRK